MTQFTPQILLRVVATPRIEQADVIGLLAQDFPLRKSIMLAAPLLPGLVAAHIQNHNIKATRPAQATEASAAAMNAELELIVRDAVQAVGAADRFELREPPKNWRVLSDGTWAPRRAPGLAFQLVLRGTVPTDHDLHECWLAIQDPDRDFWRTLET